MDQTIKLTGYPSIDKPWLKYYTEKDLDIRVPQCTVYQNIYDSNKSHAKDTAIRYFGNNIHYKTLFSKVDACAKALRQIGIKKGDFITLCTAGVPEAMYLVLACSQIGAVANFINPLFTRRQMIDRINETETKWAFVLDAMYCYIRDALPDTCIQNVVIIPVTDSMPKLLSKIAYSSSDAKKIMQQKNSKQRVMLWSSFLKSGAAFTGEIEVPYKFGMPAVMVYSSGSTGASKGILLTNDGINATIANYGVQSMNFSRGDTFLQMIPVWFSTGIIYSILMPLAKGFTVIPELKFSKESFLKDLKKYRPSITLTATSLWIYVVNSGKKVDLSNMKYPITGGEKILPQDDEQINNYFRRNGCKKKLYKGYGMCELGSEISGTTDAVNYRDKQGGSGYPILNVIVSAFDINTDKELPYGKHGELRVISPARMKEYYKNPKATSEFFKIDEQGNTWGCTGDIGYVDRDGEVFVLGRATDHYRRENGDIVYLFDIEEVILKEEAVNQCKVVDIKTSSGKRLVAHIVFRDYITDKRMILARIHKNVLNSLPDYMQPDFYKIRESMPVHSNGKRDIETLKNDMENLISQAELS